MLNHYTDLRDLAASEATPDDGCTLLSQRSEMGSSLLGQTWDTHATAIPYVMMMQVPKQDDVPAIWVLTITGCLGMCDFNQAGTGVAINNLRSKSPQSEFVKPR